MRTIARAWRARWNRNMLHCTMNVAQAGEFRKVYECKPAVRQMQGPISGLKNTVADMVKRHRAKATPIA
jgi:hypothetical protein